MWDTELLSLHGHSAEAAFPPLQQDRSHLLIQNARVFFIQQKDSLLSQEKNDNWISHPKASMKPQFH